MSTIPDFQARADALNPHESFIVQAPAGSGKTELLTQRFLALLALCKENPEEILAITFTNKAVNEMRHRITDALYRANNLERPKSAHEAKTWDLAQAVIARDKALDWGLMKNPNRLRIQTIDAFCAGLTRQLPMLSRFGASGNICEDATPYFKEAIAKLFADIEKDMPWTQALKHLLLHMDNNASALESLLIQLLWRRDQWLSYLLHEPDLNIKRDTLEASLQHIIQETLSSVKAEFPTSLEPVLCELLNYAAKNPLSKPNIAIAACMNLTSLQDAGIDEWLGAATLLLTQKNTWRASVTKANGFPTAIADKGEKAHAKAMKDALKDLIENLGGYDGLAEQLGSLKALPPEFYDEKQWEVLASLITVLPVLIGQLRLTFGEHGVIDYVENATGALEALGADDAPTDLGLRLDYAIGHILIDEFQDTSINQFRLLERLTAGWETGDGRTLFIVGDPMQSIYRFREAEVGLFLRAKEQGIGLLALTPLTLSANFRSTKTVIDWINNTFEKTFPRVENISDGAIRYNHADAILPDTEGTAIEFHPFVDATKSDEAIKIVSLIQNPDDTAILVRTKNQLRAILPALRDAGIPYRAIDIEPLASRSIIFDLTALTKAMLNLGDRTAWLSILRAPWCGLALDDLLLLSIEDEATIWDQINDEGILSTLSKDGQQRATSVTHILRHQFEVRARTSLSRWVDDTWNLLKGPECLARKSDINNANTFFTLINEAQSAGDIDDFSQLDIQISKLFAMPDSADNHGVQIMTIHKSKGLEFDTVIIPSLESKPKANAKSLLAWTERARSHDESDLLLAPLREVGSDDDKIYSYIRDCDNIKSDYEIMRLLYVACTRAKRQLHLLANVKTNADELETPNNKSLLHPIWPLFESEFATPTKQALNVAGESVKPIKYLLRLPSSEIKPSELTDHNLPTENPVERLSDSLHGCMSRIIGTTAHACFEYIANDENWWENANIESMLVARGLTTSQLSKCADIVRTAVDNTLNCNHGKWILKSRDVAHTEYALTIKSKDDLSNIILDRFFIENNEAWIIDYKIILDEEIKPEQYYPQLNHYNKALSKIHTIPINMALYFPLQKVFHVL